MKLSLVVSTAGKSEGKVIPITLSQFLIGRDPQCHLRPASALISKRHCALLMRAGKAYVRDFDSTNGTFVNDEPVKGERELHNDDRLKVGPLLFAVKLEASAPAVNKPTPPPSTKPATQTNDDESIAAMLLSLQDDGGGSGGGEVPEGSTVMEIAAPSPDGQASAAETRPGNAKTPPPKGASGDTSASAKAILEKYMKRPRT